MTSAEENEPLELFSVAIRAWVDADGDLAFTLETDGEVYEYQIYGLLSLAAQHYGRKCARLYDD